MNKLLEVCEFESITCNKDYENDASYKYLNEKIFQELEKFILTFNANEETSSADFLRIGMRRNVGKIIQARNYVGLIQMKNGFQVQILPKITNSGLEDTKKTFLRMIRSMKDFPSKIFNDANLNLDKMNLYEIFINMYIQEVRELIKKGLRSSYFPVVDNVSYFKGKLIIREQIKRNQIHKERFYIEYDEYGMNRPENRLIKSTLLKLQKLSNSAANIKGIRQLLPNFERVKSSINYKKDFSKVVIDRNTKDYKTIMQWSKVFLMNQSFTAFSGETNARALLFPMEKVFEAYVARNLKQVLSELMWEVSIQDKGYYLFNSPKKFALRPDTVIKREDGSKVILDTKWKVLIDNPNRNYGISQADMYQMYAYSKKYEASEIWLLHPVNEGMKDTDINFKSYKDEVLELKVKVFLVDLTNIQESLSVLKKHLINGGNEVQYLK
ncbi:restriction endonuclease [Bacillus cereus]|uniref:McrC family protein n=2 Tax=Bacillus cereus TaxID=1396 RepID=UPI000BED4AA0|nr:McrC family protein [Bacillus cereus]PDZ39794.1 restriction endonuclease [Bacillus cereus]PES11093.1 restriction endonuclease [Bacillus cereus]PET44034.1 restriction endonuclease [Bacillus cereus]PFA14372.1 restriction endonuclease [Bacillus cereus]PFC37674.1 restriction endonuclease [Bacillus cereus]